MGNPLDIVSPVVPAKAGIHRNVRSLDSRLRGNDGFGKSIGTDRQSPLTRLSRTPE